MNSALTLVELLAVITIVVVLPALLAPALNKLLGTRRGGAMILLRSPGVYAWGC